MIGTGKWLIAGAACMQIMMRCAIVWDTLHPQAIGDDQEVSGSTTPAAAAEGRFVDQADAIPQGHVIAAAAATTKATSADTKKAKAAVPSARPIKTTTATATAARR